MKKFFVYVLLAVLVGAVIIGIACSESTDPDPQEPTNPDMPPVSSMRICMTTFPSAEARSIEPIMHCEHFNTSAIIVAVWVTITEAAFLIPRLAFALALTQPPVYEGDSTWKWVLGPADTNNVTLTAHLLPTDSVDWSMRVSNNTLDNFLWYNGRCDFHAEGGWWKFYDPALPSDSNYVLFVDWEKDQGDTTAHFIVINENLLSEDFGDTLRYQLEGTMAEVVIHDVCALQVDRTTIEWDIEDKFGRIVYADSSEGCWDDSLECIPCDSLPLN